MDYWFISDTHFDHGNILEYSNRPFDNIQQHNEYLIRNWNDYVKPHDVVYHIGDFAMGRDFAGIERICRSLNGSIHLVPGNHDTNAKLEIYGRYFTIGPPLLHCRKPDVILCHYPLAVWLGSHHGMPHLHGHSHGSYVSEGKIIDAGVDVEPKYRPKNWDELKEEFIKRNHSLKDHHGKIIREGVAHYQGNSGSR